MPRLRTAIAVTPSHASNFLWNSRYTGEECHGGVSGLKRQSEKSCQKAQGVIRISSDGDDHKIFGGMKLSISGFSWLENLASIFLKSGLI